MTHYILIRKFMLLIFSFYSPVQQVSMPGQNDAYNMDQTERRIRNMEGWNNVNLGGAKCKQKCCVAHLNIYYSYDLNCFLSELSLKWATSYWQLKENINT